MSKSNMSVEDVLKEYNGYDFCGEKACSGQNKANELINQLYELLVNEAETFRDVPTFTRNGVSAQRTSVEKEIYTEAIPIERVKELFNA